MNEQTATLRPGEFCRLSLQALEAAEGRRRRRKRDQTPDAIGLQLKRDLLEQAAAADPAAEEFEGWLLAETLAAAASGPVRAMCAQILEEYRVAALDPGFAQWLLDGAPSADAFDDASADPDAEARRPRPLDLFE